RMLENPQDESVVRWGNDGNSFVVLENEKFTKHILPKHFKHSNFASFVRQLNKYDFHKVRHNNDEGGVSPYGPGAWEFMHPDFRMNNKDALDNIRRKAPAPRKLNVRSEETASQHLHTLQERFNELQSLYSMQCQELHHLRKVAANHETIMGNILNFLISNQKRQEGKPVPFATETANTESNEGADNEGVSIATLEQAIKMLGHYNGEQSVSSRPLEQMSEVQARLHAAITPPPDFSQRNVPPSPHAGPQSAKSSISYGDLDRMAYPPPVGMRMFPDPYALAAKQPPPPPPPPAVPFHVADVSVKKESVDAKHWVRRPRVLLVEDDPTCQRISTKFLEAFQCSIETALDGSEAVARLDGRAKYDLILMDIIMPNLDGISATHLIRQFDSTPIIAMTSNIRHDDINMYFQHGMNDVLPKPFTKDGLFNLLEKHMAHLKKPSSEVRPALP
ncbi:response regulator, partial [Piedraia hortae CBS 480.64]